MFPFSRLTNNELYETLESVEKKIKRNMRNQDFRKYIESQCIETKILDKPFDYYNTDEFSRNINKNTDSPTQDYTIIHQNIRSLDKHFGKLVALSETLDSPDIIALSEIGQKNIESRRTQLTNLGYDMKYETPQKVRGGVALIYKNTQDMDERPDLKIKRPKNVRDLDIENIWYETNIKNMGTTIIGVIYKHPNSTVTGLKTLRDELEKNMTKINDEGKSSIIMGDMNIDGLRLSTENNRKFFDMVLEQDFIPLVTLPTRIQNDKCSTIDHIFINQKIIRNSNKRIAGNIYSDISDHLPNFLILNNKKETQRNKPRPKTRIFGEKNTAKFLTEITKNWEEFYKTNDPNQALELFYKNFKEAYNNSFPMKTLSRKRVKDKKWIDLKLRQRINEKNRLYKKKLHNPTNHNTAEYNRVRNQVNNELKNAEEKYYSNLINSEKSNLRKLWEVAGTIANPNKAKKDTKISKLQVNGTNINENIDIAETLNDYFCNIGKNYAEKIKTNDEYKQYLRHKNPHSMFLYKVEEKEVSKIISSFNGNKAAGDDDIKPRLLKICNPHLSRQITHIINLSFVTGIVPEKLKIAKVIPIYKKNDKSDPNNYRPISLLSIINKIMEKLMHKRISVFLEKHKLLYKYQFSYREKHSTTQAVIEIVDNIIQELEEGNMVAGIYLDLSKAFDTVDHKILKHKLEHYGIRGLPLRWIDNYLKDRKQYTQVNGVKSELKAINYGVPQGSVLGPLLFLIYVNDIDSSTNNNKLRLFADDSNVFVVDKKAESLKDKMIEVMTSMCKWFVANKLTINMSKTAYSIFTRPNTKIPTLLNSIKMGNTTIQRVNEAKYLGITLDDKLNWKTHIQQLANSLNKTNQAFKIIKNYVGDRQKKMLYYAYTYSKIQYGIEVYSQASKKEIKKIQVKQNRALKILFNKEFRTATNKIHKDQGIMLVEDIAKTNILKFVYKQRREDTPIVFQNYFTENNQIHNLNTRQQNNLHIKIPRSNIGKKTIKYRGAILWNQTNKAIRKHKTLKTFTRDIKKGFIKNY